MYRTSRPEQKSIKFSKIWTVRKPDVFLPRNRTFNTFKNIRRYPKKTCSSVASGLLQPLSINIGYFFQLQRWPLKHLWVPISSIISATCLSKPFEETRPRERSREGTSNRTQATASNYHSPNRRNANPFEQLRKCGVHGFRTTEAAKTIEQIHIFQFVCLHHCLEDFGSLQSTHWYSYCDMPISHLFFYAIGSRA